MAIKFSQFNLRTDHTSGMYLVGYDGNQNIHITVDNLFDDFINGTENTIAMFGTGGTVLADSILSQNAVATTLTVAGNMTVTNDATFVESTEFEGTADFNSGVNLGDASSDLITQTGTLYLNGPIKDTTDTLGAVDQILVSDAAGELTFQDLLDTHVESAEVVKVPVKNVQGSALVKGDPVYISGSVGASGRLEVQLADSSNSAKMPAVGLLFQDLANNGEGYVVITGKLRNISNSPIDGVTPTEGDVIYVKPSGTSGAALTTTKPVYGNFIQNVGKVGRVNGGNSGTFVVSSILRSNDIPNLTPGRLWIGSTGNTIESQTLFVDEANTRVGINQTTPLFGLDINSTLRVVGNITGQAGIEVDGSLTINTGPSTITGELDKDGSKITNLADPTAAQDAATKAYVDSQVAATVTSVATSAPITGGTITTTGTIGITQATTSSDGYLSSTDWNIFNNKQDAITNPVTGTGAATRVAFWNSSSSISSDADLYWNDTNNRLGVGTASPDVALDVNDSTGIKVQDSGDVVFEANPSTGTFSLGDVVGVGGTAYITGDNTNIDFFGDGDVRFQNDGNVGIGTTSPSTKLEVGDCESSTNISDGNIAVKTNTNDTAIVIQEASGAEQWGLGVNADGDFIFTDSGTERIRFDDGTGNVGIATTSPSSKLQVNGAVQVADDTDTASASKVGALRYRTSGNNSYVDMCMQTGASTYAWVNIVQNNW